VHRETVTSGKNSNSADNKNKTWSGDPIKRKLLRWVLKLSGGSWQMSIARVFHSRTAFVRELGFVNTGCAASMHGHACCVNTSSLFKCVVTAAF